MQCSAPGLKNARTRLTIRPPLVPTAETAKPILKKRKPPADPGPAPFKNARFSNLTNVLEIKKKKKIAQLQERVCSRRRDLLLAATAAASFSVLRAGPGRSLQLGSRGRSQGRTRARGRASGAGRARSRGRASAARGRGWERVPGRRVGRRPRRGAGWRVSVLAVREGFRPCGSLLRRAAPFLLGGWLRSREGVSARG